MDEPLSLPPFGEVASATVTEALDAAAISMTVCLLRSVVTPASSPDCCRCRLRSCITGSTLMTAPKTRAKKPQGGSSQGTP